VPVVRFLGFNYFYFLPIAVALALLVAAWGVRLRAQPAKAVALTAVLLWLASVLVIEILSQAFSAFPRARPFWPPTYAEFASLLGWALAFAALLATEGVLLLALRSAGFGGFLSTLAGTIAAAILMVAVPWAFFYGAFIGCAFLRAQCDFP